MANCEYDIIQKELQPTVYRITHNTYLLSNITEVIFDCYKNNSRYTRNRTVNETETLIQLQCDCDIVVQDTVLPKLVEECTNTSAPTFLHLINLRILAQFFDMDELKQIFINQIFNEPVSVVLPTLMIQSKHYQVAVAIKENLHYKLDELIDSTKRQETLYSSLAHYVYTKMAESLVEQPDFNYFSIFHWILIGFCLLSVANLATNVYSYMKIRALTILMTVKTTKALKFHYTFSTLTTQSNDKETTSPYPHFGTFMAQYMPTELTIIIILVLLIIGYLWRIMNKHRRRISELGSVLFLDVVNNTKRVRLFLTKLPYSPNCYKLQSSSTEATISVQNKYLIFTTVKVHWTEMEIIELCTENTIQLPAQKFITPNQATTLRQILNDNTQSYKLFLLIDGLHKSPDVLAISDNTPKADRNETDQMSHHQNLYPQLPPT